MRGLLGPGVVLAATTVSGVANANGRFPDAQQLVVDPGDPSHIVVQTTYGFIRTDDGGKRWTWTCEDAVGYGGVLDPPIAILQGGTLISGVFDGLVVSTPDQCNYAFQGGDLTDRFTLDVSTIKSDPSHAIALTSDGTGSNQFDTRVWKSTDTGATWSQSGVALPTDFIGFTLDAAPSNEDALYVSGFTVISSDDYVGSIAVSVDGGAAWEIKSIPGSDNEAGPYIAAIDPADPSTVYVRLASLEGALLVTRDAGDTWETIFNGVGTLVGFALSPDGSQLRVGGEADGVWRASTEDFQFEKQSDLPVRCLTWTQDALYACAREAFADFTIGRSVDEGETFVPIHHLQCLAGPDDTCALDSSIATTCEGPWSAQQQILQTESCEGAGGAGGQGAGGGGNGAGGGDGGSDEGCSCSTTDPDAGPGRSFMASALVGLSLIVARRARAGRKVRPPALAASADRCSYERR